MRLNEAIISGVAVSWRAVCVRTQFSMTAGIVFASSTRPDGEAQWIRPHQGIISILIEIRPANELDRISANELPRRRVVVPMPVVMQPSFFIVLLPLKPAARRLRRRFLLHEPHVLESLIVDDELRAGRQSQVLDH